MDPERKTNPGLLLLSENSKKICFILAHLNFLFLYTRKVYEYNITVHDFKMSYVHMF